MIPGKVAIVLGVVVMLVSAACAPRATPAPTSKAPALESAVKESWEKEWDGIVAAANREGKLVIYSSGGDADREGTAGPFYAKYGIVVEFTSGRGAEITARLLNERKAGLYLVDVYVGGTRTLASQIKPAGILEPMEPMLLLPEVVNPKLWWEDRLPWVDPAHTFFAFTLYPNQALGINTDLVKSDEMRSFRDILNPKWKGKILMNDPTVAGVGQGVFSAVGALIMGWDYLRELVKQEPLITRDQRQQVEWLAHGKYPILFAPRNDPFEDFKRAGSPIQMMILQEGTYLTAGTGAVSLMNKAPHPNAAKLFINWLLSKEGATYYSQATLTQSARLDVPIEHVRLRRQPGVKYFNSENEEYLTKGVTKGEEFAKEIFGALLR